MKRNILILSVFVFILTVSCNDLNLNPVAEPATTNWYEDQYQVEMALNDLYREYLWWLIHDTRLDRWTDDWAQRSTEYDFTVGSVTSEWGISDRVWTNTYKGISRANRVIESMPKIEDEIPTSLFNKLKAEAHFFRAVFYGKLITFYGDVPFYTEELSIEEAFEMGRTDRDEVLQQIYKDFDFAINNLPVDNSGSSGETRADKGAAMAMKARYALYMSDWPTVVEATEAVMNLDKYSLYPDYGELFRSKQKTSETIFAIPRSYEHGNYDAVASFISRTAQGHNTAQPSWQLLASYLCTDGEPIDESPLFDPSNPFENRDPRLSETIVEFGTEHLGYIYEPHPDTLEVLNIETGQMVTNMDSKANTPYAAFNSLALKKFVTEEWKEDRARTQPILIMRYADVLLMYAEAKIELNEVDQSVLNAINEVRARAYKTDVSATSEYPAVTTTNQSDLRQALRIERRMEFAWEGRRYFDLLRWELFEEAYVPYYGHHPVELQRERIVEPGLWFWPETPEVNEHGIADFSPWHDDGLIALYVERHFPERQYLWPIPNLDVLINENIEQNPGY